MSGKRILLTGGAGFIGGHLAEAYLERGDEVWIVDDLSTGRRENVPEGARFFHLDLNDPKLEDVFREARGFDVVSHHAAQMDVRRSVNDPRHDARINLLGLLSVLEAGRAHGVGRVIFASSGGVVYGEAQKHPTPEGSQKLPASPYGVAKYSSELYLGYYREVHQIPYAALRYANVYGPRQDPHGEAGVVAIFSKRLAARQSITIYGDGEQTRDYVFVGDVVAANLLLTDATLPSGGNLDDRAFNVGTGDETTVNRLAQILVEHAGGEGEIVRAPARAGELFRSCLDASRLRALGWAPKDTLEAGLARTFRALTQPG